MMMMTGIGCHRHWKGRTDEAGVRLFSVTEPEWDSFALPSQFPELAATAMAGLSGLDAFASWVRSAPAPYSGPTGAILKAKHLKDQLELRLVERLDRHLRLFRDLGTDRFAKCEGDWKASGL